MNIFVGNLSSLTTEEQLKNLFSEFGEVQGVKIITEFSGRPRGFAFVVMVEKENAERAIKELDKSYLNSQPINVSEALTKNDNRRFSN